MENEIHVRKHEAFGHERLRCFALDRQPDQTSPGTTNTNQATTGPMMAISAL